MVAIQDVRRVLLGRFVRPAEETGTGQPRVEDALGYLLHHERGLLLFDTGIGQADAETLHFDHCGGNPLLAGRAVVCQRSELLDGEAELMPDVFVLPTPGHTDGHQSLVVRCADGTVVLAGQSHDHASDFAGDALAVTAGEGTGAPAPQPWLRRLLAMDPARVYFAHDASVWEPA